MTFFETMIHWWDQFFQGFIWRTFFGQMQWIDWTVVFALFSGIIYGLRKGFWKVFFDLIRILIVIVIALEFDGWIYDRFKHLKWISGDYVEMISLAVIVIPAWFASSFLIRWIRSLFVTQTSAQVRVLGGIVLGSFYTFICLSLLSQFLLLGPWPHLKDIFLKNASYTGYFLGQTAPTIHSNIMWPVRKVTGRAE